MKYKATVVAIMVHNLTSLCRTGNPDDIYRLLTSELLDCKPDDLLFLLSLLREELEAGTDASFSGLNALTNRFFDGLCDVLYAREQIEGNAPVIEWINDNGPADLKRGIELIQQKFVNAGNHLSLQAIREHFQKYPDFLNNGGKYQIPSDHYEKIKWLLSISEKEANRMPTSTGDFSLRQWKEVHDFFQTGDIPLEKLEPSQLAYDDVQKGTYQQSLGSEKANLRKRNQERRDQAYQDSKPSFEEGAKATAVSAAIEGAATFCIAVVKKTRSGKKIKDFDADDWKEILGDTGVGTLKGGVRGVSIYMLTNYTATPAAVASSVVTASFGIAEQVHRYRQGEMDEITLIENSEAICLEAAVSALSSFAGQILIPIPVVGAVIGNSVGTMMYHSAKDFLSAKEQNLIKKYLDSIQQLDNELQIQYQSYIAGLTEEMNRYLEILERAFSPDIRIAFKGSVD